MKWINIGGIDFLPSDIELLKKISEENGPGEPEGEIKVWADYGRTESTENEKHGQTGNPRYSH